MSPLATAIPSPAPTSRQPLRLVMHGAAGRMGQRIIACAAAELESWKLVAAIDRAGHPLAGSDAGTLAGVTAAGVLQPDIGRLACEDGLLGLPNLHFESGNGGGRPRSGRLLRVAQSLLQ